MHDGFLLLAFPYNILRVRSRKMPLLGKGLSNRWVLHLNLDLDGVVAHSLCFPKDLSSIPLVRGEHELCLLEMHLLSFPTTDRTILSHRLEMLVSEPGSNLCCMLKSYLFSVNYYLEVLKVIYNVFVNC